VSAKPFAKKRGSEWEWLSLIDAEGPFLSRAALKSFYPSGINAPANEVVETFPEEFARWSRAWNAAPEAYSAARNRWIEVVLRRFLDWSDDLVIAPEGIEAKSPNGAVTVRPYAALTGDGGTPSALVAVVDRTENLRAVGTDGWSANAIDRMAALLRSSGTTIGIVTDGRWWALVSAAKDVTTASGVWDALLWQEERPSRDAFLALASFRSIAGGLPEKRLPLLFSESVASAEQITEALGDQVRRAVELVLQSMSDTHLRAGLAGEGSPLPDDPKVVYEGAVTMLMRIVFLLFAEERGLLPAHDIYRSAYGIAGLREQLQREATQTSIEALDHSWEGWHRLLAASNAVYNGVSYPDARMPAYGGSLFDPDRFPWLQATDSQGRLQVRLSDRAMLAVLRAVQTIEDGAMQLSFRDLDVEQIGYVYEGLLGYSAEYVSEVTVGLQGKAGFEPEIPLRELEAIAAASSSAKDFADRLIAHLKKTQEFAKPRTSGQIAKAYSSPDPEERALARTRLRHALLGDDELAERLEPFHALIRNDLRGFPYVVPEGGLVMTESAQRANTGTHYTPRALAEEVVLHALEPLVYSPGPLDTENPEEWVLKSSAEILDLKIADIAVGSGAFLVAAARYLADRLLEARAKEGLDVSGEPDLKRWAIREVVARCLYGADINAMAVEMCKLSLWLISMDPGKPFSFVDDRVFHGNSLLGVTTEEQLKAQHIYPKQSMKRQLAAFDVDKDLDHAARLRRELASGQVDEADRMRSTRAKRALLAQSRDVTARLREVADGIIAAGLLEGGKPGRKLEDRYHELAESLREAYPVDGSTGERRRLDAIISAGLAPRAATGESRWKPLHWILEAPDVILDHGGFDAIIGNPPFLGGKKISPSMGSNMQSWLTSVIAARPGNGDLAAYFFLRASTIANPNGQIAFIATNSISQGDTREIGLDQILASGIQILRSERSREWPTRVASVTYSVVWLTAKPLAPGVRVRCDGQAVDCISSLLESAGQLSVLPTRLRENRDRAFQGCIPLGKGFVIDGDLAHRWLSEDPRVAEVVRPYVIGEDLNQTVDSGATRFVIDFDERDESHARRFVRPWAHLEANVYPERARKDAKKYPRMVNEWWKFWNPRKALRARLKEVESVIAIARVSNSLSPAMVSSNQVFSEQCVVFPEGDPALLAALSSAAHQSWTEKYGSTIGTGVRYSPTDVFETFPLPPLTDDLRGCGQNLLKARAKAMHDHGAGLTELNRLLTDESAKFGSLAELRAAIRDVDLAVIAAYGWSDIHPVHGPHRHDGRLRYTIDPGSRAAVLDRLLAENQRRAAIEAQQSPTKARRGKSLEESEMPEGALF